MTFRAPLSWAFCLTVGVLSVSSLHAQQDGEFLFRPIVRTVMKSPMVRRSEHLDVAC